MLPKAPKGMPLASGGAGTAWRRLARTMAREVDDSHDRRPSRAKIFCGASRRLAKTEALSTRSRANEREREARILSRDAELWIVEKNSAPLIRATTCARLRRERARPLRRGLECTVLTASTVAARAPRRTSRPTHAPEPRDSPPDGPLVHLLHICFTKAVRPSLAATRPWGWRSDAARGALTRAASAPRRPGRGAGSGRSLGAGAALRRSARPWPGKSTIRVLRRPQP